MAEQSQENGGPRQLQCVVVTPEATVLDVQAEFVALPLIDGEIGVYPLRAPLIGRLGYGEMRIRQEGKFESYYVDGGFVQIADNVVSVLTNQAMPSSEVVEDVARELLQSAREKPANTDELLAIRDRIEAQARGRLTVARRAK